MTVTRLHRSSYNFSACWDFEAILARPPTNLDNRPPYLLSRNKVVEIPFTHPLNEALPLASGIEQGRPVRILGVTNRDATSIRRHLDAVAVRHARTSLLPGDHF